MKRSEGRPLMSWVEVCAGIAQGAINIAEGITTIEPESRIHDAMSDFCEYMSKGLVTPAMIANQTTKIMLKNQTAKPNRGNKEAGRR
jgi:hypothetical protein